MFGGLSSISIWLGHFIYTKQKEHSLITLILWTIKSNYPEVKTIDFKSNCIYIKKIVITKVMHFLCNYSYLNAQRQTPLKEKRKKKSIEGERFKAYQ